MRIETLGSAEESRVGTANVYAAREESGRVCVEAVGGRDGPGAVGGYGGV